MLGDQYCESRLLVAEGEGRLLYSDTALRAAIDSEPTNDKKSNWSLRPLS
jgi:hypothetical protein